METTSTYWLNLAVYLHLHHSGFALTLINPAQAHFFAKSQLKKAKTDALDAASLAAFAHKHQSELAHQDKQWSPPPQIYHELRQRLAHRDQLLAIRTQLNNQLHSLLADAVVIAQVQEGIEQLIAHLNKQLKELEKEIGRLASDHEDDWAKTITLLQTIPGIGLMSAALLVTVFFNFTNCASVEAATQYVGLAPNPRTSGSSLKGRGQLGKTGNGAVRKMLYMATLSAARYNPAIRAYYEEHSRTRQSKQPMKVARCGAARKLLHLAYAVATKGQPLDATYYERQKALCQQPKRAGAGAEDGSQPILQKAG